MDSVKLDFKKLKAAAKGKQMKSRLPIQELPWSRERVNLISCAIILETYSIVTEAIGR